MKYTEIRLSGNILKQYAFQGIMDVRIYDTSTGCHVMVSRDGGLMHLSISHKDRLPTWEEVKEARYDLLEDDLYMAQILPPTREYVDVHPFCLHLFELKTKEMI